MSDPELEENREEAREKFVRERIVNRQSGKRWIRKVLTAGVCGILFGLAAGIAMAAILPRAMEWFAEEETQPGIVIPPDSMETESSAERESGDREETESGESVPESQAEPGETQSETGESQAETGDSQTETAESSEGAVGLSREEVYEIVIAELERMQTQWPADISAIDNLHELLSDLGEAYLQAVVTVEMTGTGTDWFNNQVETSGYECAGIIWNELEDGTLYIVSSGEIPADGTEIQVLFHDGSRRNAVFCQADAETGLVMLMVEGSEVGVELREAIQILPLGNSYSVNQGDPLLIVGNTNGHVGSVVYTLVTYADDVLYGADSVYRRVLLDCVTAEGANGFALSLDGQIMGVITPDTAGTITSMLAISDLKGVMQLLANSQPIPYVGIVGQTVTEELSETYGLPMGVYVTEVQAGSPAYEAGIKAGDVLIRLNDSELVSIRVLRNLIEGLSTEVPATIAVMRAGNEEYQELEFQIIPGVR